MGVGVGVVVKYFFALCWGVGDGGHKIRCQNFLGDRGNRKLHFYEMSLAYVGAAAPDPLIYTCVIVRPGNGRWACQKEHCHSLSI